MTFDKSVRDSMSDVLDMPGEIIFEPKHFSAADLNQGLRQSQLPKQRLLDYGQLAS